MTVVDDYLAKLEPGQKKELERIRKIVRKAAPDADEVISYGMPGFKQNGKYLITFGAFKNHLSIFPGAEPAETLEKKLGAFRTTKGTIQFTEDKPVPEDLIAELVKIRLEVITRD